MAEAPARGRRQAPAEQGGTDGTLAGSLAATTGRRVTVLVPMLVAVGLASAWLLAPPMGTDLSAQIARAEFFTAHGWAVLDLRWYGGVSPFGYSLVSPPLMAWFGPRPVGALAVVVATGALLILLLRTGARRPLLAGVLGAVCFTGNLVSGRVTFGLGVAFGLLALVALVTLVRPRAPGRSVGGVGRSGVAGRWGVAGRLGTARGRVLGLAIVAVLAALAGATSPVAGLFLLLVAAAVLLGRRGIAGGLALLGGAAAPMLLLAGAFSAGGWMNMSRADMLHATVTSLAVAALVPRRVVRIGALLSAGGVLAAYLLPTAVGLNATRLATMFALPLLAGYALAPSRPGWLRRLGWLRRRPDWLRPPDQPRWPGRWRWPGAAAAWPAVVLLAVFLWQPPVIYQDLRDADAPAAYPGFHTPLIAELAHRELPGRVEVVPTVGYWEVGYLGDLPLARGWLRQADLEHNSLFFDGTLDAETYRRWLHENAVSYVALPDAPVSWVGRAEAELVRGGLPYLTLVWEHQHWRLYEVEDAVGVVVGPARLTRHTGAAVRFEATGPGEVLLRVRWSRWLTVSGPGEACLRRDGDWTVVRTTHPGEYTITGGLRAGPGCAGSG